MTLHTQEIANAHAEMASNMPSRSVRRARRRRGFAALSVRVATAPGFMPMHGPSKTYEEIL